MKGLHNNPEHMLASLVVKKQRSAFHTAGIESQALARLQAAKAPWNQLLWTPPSVLFYFPSGVGEDVAGSLLSPLTPLCAPLDAID